MALRFRIELEFEMLVFEVRGKPEYPEKNPRSKDENQQQIKLNPHLTPSSGTPGHIGGRRVLLPLRYPCAQARMSWHNFTETVSLRLGRARSAFDRLLPVPFLAPVERAC